MHLLPQHTDTSLCCILLFILFPHSRLFAVFCRNLLKIHSPHPTPAFYLSTKRWHPRWEGLPWLVWRRISPHLFWLRANLGLTPILTEECREKTPTFIYLSGGSTLGVLRFYLQNVCRGIGRVEWQGELEHEGWRVGWTRAHRHTHALTHPITCKCAYMGNLVKEVVAEGGRWGVTILTSRNKLHMYTNTNTRECKQTQAQTHTFTHKHTHTFVPLAILNFHFSLSTLRHVQART